jgi:chromatin remodeling complex protein RSC6
MPVPGTRARGKTGLRQRETSQFSERETQRFVVLSLDALCVFLGDGMAKKTVKKKAAPKKKAARKPNAAFMKPVTPSETLAAVVGSKPMPRTEVTKKLWGYIKKNGLQDAKNRRMINADANLKAVFGGKSSVNMFAMTKLVSKHLK